MTPGRMLFLVAAACAVVAELLILRSALSGRAGGTAEAEASPARRAVELAYAVVPALALAAILYLTWRAVDAPMASNGEAPARASSPVGVLSGA